MKRLLVALTVFSYCNSVCAKDIIVTNKGKNTLYVAVYKFEFWKKADDAPALRITDAVELAPNGTTTLSYQPIEFSQLITHGNALAAADDKQLLKKDGMRNMFGGSTRIGDRVLTLLDRKFKVKQIGSAQPTISVDLSL